MVVLLLLGESVEDIVVVGVYVVVVFKKSGRG